MKLLQESISTLRRLYMNKSTDCVHGSSVNTFNNRIDKYLVRAGRKVYVESR